MVDYDATIQWTFRYLTAFGSFLSKKKMDYVYIGFVFSHFGAFVFPASHLSSNQTVDEDQLRASSRFSSISASIPQISVLLDVIDEGTASEEEAKR
ncbi:uncharacterized protein V6R79_003651 [Siganus canaliculatus]